VLLEKKFSSPLSENVSTSMRAGGSAPEPGTKLINIKDNYYSSLPGKGGIYRSIPKTLTELPGI
jgi:hypothetical protein